MCAAILWPGENSTANIYYIYLVVFLGYVRILLPVAICTVVFVTLGSALQDTAVWDLSVCPRPSSYSTPNRETPWSEVVICGRKRDWRGAPRLSLSNRFAALSADHSPVHSSDVPPAAAPPRQDLAASARVSGCSAAEPQQPAFRTATSSAWRRILKEAVLRRSGGERSRWEIPLLDPTVSLPYRSRLA